MAEFALPLIGLGVAYVFSNKNDDNNSKKKNKKNIKLMMPSKLVIDFLEKIEFKKQY